MLLLLRLRVRIAGRDGQLGKTKPFTPICNLSGSRQPRRGDAGFTRSRPSISMAAACASTRNGRCPPATSPRGRSSARGGRGPDRPRRQPQRPPAGPRHDRASPTWSSAGYVIVGWPDEEVVTSQPRGVATRAQCRPPDAAAAVRQHRAELGGPTTPASLQSRVMPKLKGLFLRMGGPLVAASRCHAPSAPR